ncbi:MAG: diguanylate cyclase, partial [Methylococcaceae bacterium]|nr:diguanylate cyclase [Methylococcaceae bacterium]
MIYDMKPEHIIGEYQEATLNLYGGMRRLILYTEIETPY